MFTNPFSDAELERRLTAVREMVVGSGLDAAVIASPENVFWLTGLDHWGYFAPHLLVVPLDRRPVLITRQMEEVSVADMVRHADFRGHSDSETAGDEALRVLADLGLLDKRLGIEKWTSGLSHGLGSILMSSGNWVDFSGSIDRLRLMKSDEELVLMRRAAETTNAGTKAAIEAVVAGAREADIAAECLSAITRAGSATPGFGPFIRPAARLGQEHTTWGDGSLPAHGSVFLELSGCVGRYHAPNGRLVHLGSASEQDVRMAEIAVAAFDAVCTALRPGAKARDVYAAWQQVVDEAGLPDYRRHHCGYAVGVGMPPSWTGGNTVTGLRHDSDLVIGKNMSFHVLSWLMGTGQGDFFLSNTVLVGADVTEVLTTTPVGPTVR